MKSIAFIGAGNMAFSMIGGLVAQGYPATEITASDPHAEALMRLEQQFGVKTTRDNLAACDRAEVIVLAVKPQVLKPVAEALTPALKHRPLIISIAAGISSKLLNKWLGKDIAVVRCMPNTPALVQQGASGHYANSKVSTEQKQQATQLLNTVGMSIWVDNEDLINAVTAVSGSGPAYFFLLMEAMIKAGVKQGLSADQAHQLTLQTAVGAAALVQQSDVTVEELRRRVTSPGGTTEQAILSFERAGFEQMVDNALAVCAKRSQTIASELS